MNSKVSAWFLTLMTAVAVSACGGGGGGGATSTSETDEGLRRRAASSSTPLYALSVAVTGQGTVGSSPSGMTCATASCSSNLVINTAYALSATPASGYVFGGWSGACSGTGACTVTMTSAKSVSATFIPTVTSVTPTVTAQSLSVSVSGTGSVVSTGVIDCSTGTCSSNVNTGTAVTLTASPSTGWKLASWSGDCSGSGTTCSLDMSAARSVVATFALDTASDGCNITRSTTTGSYTVASSHPKVLFNHAQTVNCLKGMATANTVEFQRVKAFVDSEVAGGVNNTTNFGFPNWLPALLYKVTGNTTYRDFSIGRVNKIVTDAMALINAGKPPAVTYDSFLYVGENLGEAALVFDWCYDTLTPTQRSQWIAYMNAVLYNVWNPGSGNWNGVAWNWTGWSTDDPFNNYHYSFLEATALVGLATQGDNPQAQGWLDFFRVTKFGNTLVPKFNSTSPGGGSIEGTNYGVAQKRLFRLYDWWERSTGERIADLSTHARNSLNWMVHQITPDTTQLVSFGDQSRDHLAPFFDYNREYLLTLIALYPQDRASATANLMLKSSRLPKVNQGFETVWDFLYKPPTLVSANLTDLSTAWYGAGTGDLFMRSAWGDSTATFAAVKCGEQFESHQHFEQGAFQIYRGEWLAPTGNRFSRSGLQSSVQSKNNARFEDAAGSVQMIGKDYITGTCGMAGVSHNADYTYASMKMTPVYHGHPSVAKHEREFVFIRPSTFVVFDRVVATSASTKRIWSLNLPKAPTSISGDKLTFVGDVSNRMDVHRVAPAGLTYQVTPFDYASYDIDTNCCSAASHIDVVDASANTATYFLHVIGTSGNATTSPVTSVTSSPATGMTGAQINLTDGRVVTVRFNNTTTGGTVEFRNSSGTVTRTEPLASTVNTPRDFVN